MIPLEYPNAALWFIRYLSQTLPEHFPGTPVLGEVPSLRPKQFVQVTDAGGREITPVTGSPQLIVDSWAPSTRDAQRLSARVFALAKASQGVTVQGVRCRAFEALGFPVDMPDPDSRSPRYRQNVLLSFRAVPVS